MKWVKYDDETMKIPVKSWCEEIDPEAWKQALNLANHPAIKRHVALMPDCHVGYGMPIGGVIASENAVIPNAVGVDIGCGMGAVETSFYIKNFKDKQSIREILEWIKKRVPVGEGHSHAKPQAFEGFQEYLSNFDVNEVLEKRDSRLPDWLDHKGWALALKNLGTLGGGNHFIEMQKDQQGMLWLMVHSGSRNLGLRIANYYHKLAIQLNEKYHTALPSKDLAFIPMNSEEGKAYLRDMDFALNYAKENRRRMMEVFKNAILEFIPEVSFKREINIHHNYAAIETHFGKTYYIHRKGATSAKKGEKGIIPGSMGTPSYIVEGLGNPDSFMSCSHGAGRKLGRTQACKALSKEEADRAMEGIVYDRWNKLKSKHHKKKDHEGLWDLGEAPQAYKNIDEVIESEKDLVTPLVKLEPIGVIKG